MTGMVMSYVKQYGSAFDNDDMLDLPNNDEEDELTKKQTKRMKLEQHAVLNIPDTEMTVRSRVVVYSAVLVILTLPLRPLQSNVLFHAFEDVVVVGSGSNQLSVWSLEEGIRLRRFNNHVNTASSPARMTNIQWINEARSSLLCVGTTDGAVRVWRDVFDSSGSDPALATALNVLPDINLSDRGSGLVFDWLQSSGKLVAGGNSSTVS